MSKGKMTQINTRIIAIKKELKGLGDMRPGSLTVQYKDPKKRIGPFYQISYTHKMRSKTNYVRSQFVKSLRKEVKTYKRFRWLVEQWVELAIEKSQTTMKMATEKAKKLS